MEGIHKTCHRNGDHNSNKQTCFGRDSPLLINVTVTVNEIQVPPSQSLSQVGVEVILWTAHCTSYSVSWLYQSFLNCPNELVHCIPVPLLCLLYWFCYQFYSMLSSIVVAQDLDNLPSQPSLHFYARGSWLWKKLPGVNFFSKPRQGTYLHHNQAHYHIWKFMWHSHCGKSTKITSCVDSYG